VLPLPLGNGKWMLLKCVLRIESSGAGVLSIQIETSCGCCSDDAQAALKISQGIEKMANAGRHPWTGRDFDFGEGRSFIRTVPIAPVRDEIPLKGLHFALAGPNGAERVRKDVGVCRRGRDF